MAISWKQRSVMASLLLAVCCALLPGQDGNASRIAAIHAEWKKRQSQIKTLTCSARIESFYPKGYLKEEIGISKDGVDPGPAQDIIKKGEPISWELDFTEPCARVEFNYTAVYVHNDNSSELALQDGLHVFKNKQTRLFRKPEMLPEAYRNLGVINPNVVIHHGDSSNLLFELAHSPLFWLTGAVNGQTPSIHGSKSLAEPSRFTWRGEAETQGHKCIVLSIQEQNSKTAIREFWVGADPPHPIWSAKARNGNEMRWNIDIQYREEKKLMVPTGWVWTGHSRSGRTYHRQTYSVDQIKVNPTLDPERCRPALEPGMIVNYIPNNKIYMVMEDGMLGPMGTPPKKRNMVPWVVGGGVTIAFLWILAARYRFRKTLQPKGPSA